jgi:hypothetical protein
MCLSVITCNNNPLHLQWVGRGRKKRKNNSWLKPKRGWRGRGVPNAGEGDGTHSYTGCSSNPRRQSTHAIWKTVRALHSRGTRIDAGIGPYPKPPESTSHLHSLFPKTNFDNNLSRKLKKTWGREISVKPNGDICTESYLENLTSEDISHTSNWCLWSCEIRCWNFLL